MKKCFVCSPFYLLLFCLLLITSYGRQPNSDIAESNNPELKLTPKTTSPYEVSDSMVRSIFEDSKGNFWFGRDHAGLSRYNGKFLTHFTVKDGLGDNQIRTIQEDRNGNIWFGTGGGISSYDGETFTIRAIRDNLTS